MIYVNFKYSCLEKDNVTDLWLGTYDACDKLMALSKKIIITKCLSLSILLACCKYMQGMHRLVSMVNIFSSS